MQKVQSLGNCLVCLKGIRSSKEGKETIQDGSGLHREVGSRVQEETKAGVVPSRVLFEACELLRGGDAGRSLT